MKKALKIVALILFVGFVVIQFIRPDLTNPPVVASETIESSMQIPENVQKILTTSCKDCHSNETNYPLYSKIQPSGWFLKDHIDEGRSNLNFSVWNTYETRKKKRKLEEICEQVEIKEMPLPSYLWIHWDAKLSESDTKTLCDWAKAESAKIPE
jgi:hypothetical protein